MTIFMSVHLEAFENDSQIKVSQYFDSKKAENTINQQNSSIALNNIKIMDK